MSNSDLKQVLSEYINQTRFATLATVRSDKAPVMRVMGSFVSDGLDVFFSTRAKTGKVEHIAQNNWVSFYFQHEGQDPSKFKSVALIGTAHLLTHKPELDKAIRLLSERNPRFKARIQSEEAKDTLIYKIQAKQLKYLDYSLGPEAAQKELVLG
jgi:general stress protein 26